MTVSELSVSPWMARAFAFAFGAAWGSFVNVVVHRVPRDMSVARPGSHCPACGKPIGALDNVPILSWLVLRGRARCCGARISPRYAVVELLGALVAVAIYEAIVRPLPGDTTLLHAGSIFLADFALAMALMSAAFIDMEHMYLPDAITIGGTLFGLATPSLRDLAWTDAFAGAAAGFGAIWLLIVAYKALRGVQGMGLGDAKLVMLAGAWFGWRGAAFALLAGAVQATVATLVILAVRGKIEEPEAVKADREALQKAAAEGDAEAKKAIEEDPIGQEPAEGVMMARLPFGPFLCLAIVEWMLGRQWIVEHLPPVMR